MENSKIQVNPTKPILRVDGTPCIDSTQSKSNYSSYLLIPIRAVVEVVSVVNKDLLADLDVVCGSHAGDDAEARVVEGDELGVGHERVVGLVGQGGSVVRLIP